MYLGMTSDCLVFEEDGILQAAVVDLKGRGYRLEHALAQLRAGEALVAKIMSELGIKNYKIYLIIVAPRHPASKILLRHIKRTSLASKRSRIITARCGDTFSDARRPRLSR